MKHHGAPGKSEAARELDRFNGHWPSPRALHFYDDPLFVFDKSLDSQLDHFINGRHNQRHHLAELHGLEENQNTSYPAEITTPS